MTWMQERARQTFFAAATHISHGSLDIVCPDRTYQFGQPGTGPAAMLVVHDERVFLRALTGGDLALGEAFVDGDFSSPDLVTLLRLAVRNMAVFHALNGPWSWLSRQAASLSHWGRRNTKEGSRKNIAAHYDLGNEFFGLFLDRELAYSSAWFDSPEDSLEQAQINKFDRICRKLQLSPRDHVLEIGTGWGGFAAYAASRYGCRITSTTISREQFEGAQDRISRLGAAGDRVTLLFEDYRDLKGQFDKLVSIEMFEAVGLEHYDTFFRTCDRLTSSTGAALLQFITMNDQDFHKTYRGTTDWIQTYIFPGSELGSLSEIHQSLGRVTRFRPFHLEDMGRHYALTLAAWRERFHDRVDDVRRLGMDDRFIRMWDLYLAYCEAGFAERHISVVQMQLTRGYHDDAYHGDPGFCSQGVAEARKSRSHGDVETWSARG
jgi:cyclopropane-fatty-acyl-phospholipid synthase